MRLFFYYPQDEYVAFLMGVDELDFVDEIDTAPGDHYVGNINKKEGVGGGEL